MNALEAKVADSDVECQCASFWIVPGDGWSGPMATCSRYVRKKKVELEGREKVEQMKFVK